MPFKGTRTSCRSNVDATTNSEKILPTGRNRDGPPRRIAFHTSTGLPYLFMLLSSLYQSTSANICCSFPIYFSWSQGSPSIDLSLIVCSGCNYPCRSQRPTFKLETKFLWTNNDTSKLPDCFARQSYLKWFLHTCF